MKSAIPPPSRATGPIRNETALGWFTRLGHNAVIFRTGHEQFDALKCLVAGSITEIVGKEATGKLQVEFNFIFN